MSTFTTSPGVTTAFVQALHCLEKEYKRVVSVLLRIRRMFCSECFSLFESLNRSINNCFENPSSSRTRGLACMAAVSTFNRV